jgi:DNA repair exonuclease SbcCD ATPase subunit
MATLLKLARGNPAPPSAARVELAERIEALQAAKERLQGIHAALDGDGRVSWSALWAAEAAVKTANENLEAAKQAAADFLMRDAIGKAEGAEPSLAAARAAVLAAEDRVAAIRAARDKLNAEIKPAEETIERAGYYRDDAVRGVLYEEAEGVLAAAVAELQAMHKQLVEKHLALSLLIFEATTPNQPMNVPALSEIKNRATFAIEQWPLSHMPNASPSRVAWQAAIKALADDANAKLPERI